MRPVPGGVKHGRLMKEKHMIEINEKMVGVVAGLEGGQAVSALPDDAAEAKAGERDGRHWALFKATAPQLSVLAAMAAEYATLDDDADDTAESLDDWLMVNVAGVYDLEDLRGYRRIFRTPSRQYSKPYLHGFVRAAAATWKECLEPINAN